MDLKPQDRKLSSTLPSVLLLMALLSACASRGKVIEARTPPVRAAEEMRDSQSQPVGIQGEPAPEEESSQPDFLPISDGVNLILGPGWFRTWAAAGILLELQERKIPIHQIYALEMSAWIAATYAEDPRPNMFTWRLQKIQNPCLEWRPNPLKELITGNQAPLEEGCVRATLESAFGSKRLEAFDIPIQIGSDSGTPETLVEQPGVFEWRREGVVSDRVASGLSYPGILKLTEQPFGPLSEPKKKRNLEPAHESPYPWLIVDLVSSEEEASGCRAKKSGWGEAPDHYVRDLCLFSKSLAEVRGTLLKPLRTSAPPFELKGRNELIYQGRLAVRTYIEQQESKQDSKEGSHDEEKRNEN